MSSDCFSESTGYAYHDLGRQTLEAVYANVFKGEAALVRPQISSGTHAISICLSLLEPGKNWCQLVAPLRHAADGDWVKGQSKRSLVTRGVKYREVPLKADGTLDFEAIAQAVTPNTRMVTLQRSRGYSWRPPIDIAHISEAVEVVRKSNPNCIFFVDNCYGEFVEPYEPLEAGADLIAGSLIKNPGGSLAVSGGYIVGREDLVELCAEILTAPHLGGRIGSTFGLTRQLLHGLFLAPHIVGEALYGALLAAEVFTQLGYETSPGTHDKRTDIVQAIRFPNKEELWLLPRHPNGSTG